MPKRITPAERVERLRHRYSPTKGKPLSHDRFAALVREKGKELGIDVRPHRQRIMTWEDGAGISAEYAQVLAAMDGSSPEVFRLPVTKPQFRATRREVVRLREDVRDLRRDVDVILESLGLRPTARPESQ